MTIDQLDAYGLERMDDEAIRDFLATQSTGVLGLPTDDVPYLLPLSYGFDGESHLYFTYLLGDSSDKQELTEQAGSGRFLVYDVETQFEWQSVLLTGDLVRVPEDTHEEITAVARSAWQPNTLKTATTAGGTAIYEFTIRTQTGIQQTGLAPDLRENIEP